MTGEILVNAYMSVKSQKKKNILLPHPKTIDTPFKAYKQEDNYHKAL